MKKEVVIYPRIIERIEDWPIFRLSKDRSEFIREIDEFTFKRLVNKHRKDLSDVIVKTMYNERIRIKEDPWKVDPPNERQFWNRISKKLIKKSLDRDDPQAKAVAEDILQKIIHRYSEEIVGTFQIPTFRFAQRFLTAFFNRIFNAAVGKSLRSIWRGRRHLYERLNVMGDAETVRELFKHGTVIVVPTHSSNLDSILVGYALDQILGMPSFSYGAGLNLYNFGPAAYFMNRLGAYRVDRRKKNAVYLETLKVMSNLSIQRGVNTLFFPGGTRSRSGELEKDLKMGLLGTSVEAQRAMCQQNTGKKVFIVPLVICYNFVLEAPFLIEQHLRSTGKENYIRLRDEGKSVRGWLRFIWRFFSTTSDITLSVGRPLDVLGNMVDKEGRSYDRFGNALDISEYFTSKNEVNEDRQREEEYTKLLAERIVERYHIENVVLSSHLTAFAVFEMLLHENPKLDLFGILRLPPDDYMFPFHAVVEVVEQMQTRLYLWEQQGKIRLAPEIHRSPEDVVRDGVKNLGIFHAEKPLSLTKEGHIVSSNFRVLYFYHNRLQNYDLHKAVQWKTAEIEVLKVD
ncbi:MAG TPA: 1-acyl-sn-glycerol-3-phosphate acyltransferase [Saprospiraceae bacterium]|nr:1-acyl-sn-glycerol-3-phosphate acyltransferase [Saprospiraceae bacterium]HPI05029.1 1-acyl-sn-glycerol-3-phosphate acyltransferase [Saprospiraceae bacterium]